MNELLALLIPALAMALLHFLWQGVLVALLAWLALALLRNARPQARYAVACIALLACALLPLIDLMLGLRGSGLVPSLLITTQAVGGSPAIASGPALFDTGLLASTSGNAFAWIVVAWAAGAGLLSLRMLLGVLWVRRLCGEAITDPGRHWQDCVDRLARRFGIRRTISLRIVATGDSPVSAGWWRPVVLVPAAVVARMPAELLEALLAHELAHIRRHDYLFNLVQSAVEALLFYHPVVWWLSARIRIERELVADSLAGDVLGERRRLAIALSELDRVGNVRSPFPQVHFAQAAHGGQLMSRIQQLLRPQHRNIGATLALPLLGLFVAGIAFYAHASYRPQTAPNTSVTPAATPAPSAVTLARTSPLPTPQVTSGPVIATSEPTAADPAMYRSAGVGNRSYALVRKDREGFSMSGSTDDVDDIRLARRSIDGDFIWLRREGKAYVIRDATVLARVEKAWLQTDALDAQMRLLDSRMQPHQKKMEALQARMERRQAALEEPAAMRETQRQMEALGHRMESVGKRQETLARQMSNANDAQRDELSHRMDALTLEQDGLTLQMDEHTRVMDDASHEMERMHAPMEAIGREMEAAARPMEAIGKDMEALGSQIEREARIADQAIRTAIDDAVQRGLAMPAPAPTRQ